MSENSKMVAILSIVVVVLALLLWGGVELKNERRAECMERGSSYIADRGDLAFFCENLV